MTKSFSGFTASQAIQSWYKLGLEHDFWRLYFIHGASPLPAPPFPSLSSSKPWGENFFYTARLSLQLCVSPQSRKTVPSGYVWSETSEAMDQNKSSIPKALSFADLSQWRKPNQPSIFSKTWLHIQRIVFLHFFYRFSYAAVWVKTQNAAVFLFCQCSK